MCCNKTKVEYECEESRYKGWKHPESMECETFLGIVHILLVTINPEHIAQVPRSSCST